MQSLKDKIAVVTGAGSGIGQQIAVQLAQAGVKVAAVDISAERLTETMHLVGSNAGTFRRYTVDVAQREELLDLAEKVDSDLGPADILINNAGILIRSERFDQMPDRDVDLLFDINLAGVVNGTAAFLPQLLSRREASLVNVSSLGGLVGLMKQAPYAGAKFAVRGFSESLRMDLYETAVSVTIVFPGPVETNLFTNSPALTAEEGAQAQEQVANYRTTTAESAAAQVVRGIRKKKKRVLIGRDTKIMDILSRVAPAAYTKLLYKQVKKMMDVTTTN